MIFGTNYAIVVLFVLKLHLRTPITENNIKINFFIRKAKTDDFQGRISGSEIWRISRGEVQSAAQSQHVWQIKHEDIIDNSVTIRYSVALNTYEYISGNKTIKKLMGWENGTFEFKEVFRKEENDWNMVYLARKSKIDWYKLWGCLNAHSIPFLVNFFSFLYYFSSTWF